MLWVHATGADDAKVGDEGAEKSGHFRPDHIMVIVPVLPTGNDDFDAGIAGKRRGYTEIVGQDAQ